MSTKDILHNGVRGMIRTATALCCLWIAYWSWRIYELVFLLK